MARRGEGKGQKRISLEKVRPEKRKEKVWAIRIGAGPHSRKSSVPLGAIVRDVLKIAENIKEVKVVLNSGAIKVDGRIRKEIDFPIGLFDVVEIDAIGKSYRAVFDRKGRIAMKETKKESRIFKLCKIEKKRTGKGGRVILTTNDGRTVAAGKEAGNVGDSIKLELPKQNIAETYPMKEGSIVYLVGGAKIGTTARIRSISAGTMRREKVVTIEQNSEEFQTTEENIFVVGKDKAVIEVGEGK